MKLSPNVLAAVTIFALMLGGVPASAQIYDNGPIQGRVMAFQINNGFAVVDTVSPDMNSQTTGITLGVWVANCLPPAPCEPTSFDLAFGTSAFGSDIANYTDLVPTPTLLLTIPSGIPLFGRICQVGGCTVYSVTASIPGGIPLSAGSAVYMTISNATNSFGSKIYWDVNNGAGCTTPGCPSTAQTLTVPRVPSESFKIF